MLQRTPSVRLGPEPCGQSLWMKMTSPFCIGTNTGSISGRSCELQYTVRC